MEKPIFTKADYDVSIIDDKILQSRNVLKNLTKIISEDHNTTITMQIFIYLTDTRSNVFFIP